jgi:hypothetical protein
MTNNRRSSRWILFAVLFSLDAFAASAPRRISSKLIDLGKVYPIYMVAGMATLIEFPGPVSGIRTGNPDSIQYFRPDKPENEVTIVLQNQNAKPTNLIVRTGKKKYVFDIVPSKTVHQDTLEVIGDYGGAEIDDSEVELVDSSEKPHAKEAKK